MSEVYKKLIKIQQDLKVPKNQYNDFGGYNFRSCENILETAKPVLAKHNCAIKVGDELVVKGDRYYIKATVIIIDLDSGDATTNSAYAREAENKKGMDKSQITGTASSYARKYALDGIFALDESKDADATNKHGKGKTNKNTSKENKSDEQTITADTLEGINSLIDDAHELAPDMDRSDIKSKLYSDFADEKSWKKFFINENSTSEKMAKQFLDYLKNRLDDRKKSD